MSDLTSQCGEYCRGQWSPRGTPAGRNAHSTAGRRRPALSVRAGPLSPCAMRRSSGPPSPWSPGSHTIAFHATNGATTISDAPPAREAVVQEGSRGMWQAVVALHHARRRPRRRGNSLNGRPWTGDQALHGGAVKPRHGGSYPPARPAVRLWPDGTRQRVARVAREHGHHDVTTGFGKDGLELLNMKKNLGTDKITVHGKTMV